MFHIQEQELVAFSLLLVFFLQIFHSINAVWKCTNVIITHYTYIARPL